MFNWMRRNSPRVETSPERRDSRRVSSRGAFDVAVGDGAGEVVDASYMGLRVRTRVPLSEGNEVTCLITGVRSQYVTCRVRWVRDGEYGLAVVNTPDNPRSVQSMAEAMLALHAQAEAV